jgi:RimJ/RimL family protein N-acetyltransferase
LRDLPLPVGEPTSEGKPERVPRKQKYEGRFATLSPVNASEDVGCLFECSHGTNEKEALWTYMGYGPFENQESMQLWLQEKSETSEPTFLTVHTMTPGRPVGMVSFLNIVPDMRRVELGHIWYCPEAQRTKINTEAIYLMLCEAFDWLDYRRVEWKCDALNERSRAAALRIGFAFEGIFLNHMIVKGRSRDTAWFAMVDSEWSVFKRNLEAWLYDNTDGSQSLSQMNSQIRNQDA